MSEVKITWIGHACFKLEYRGYALVTDPYADGSVDGLDNVREQANAVYCSHGHHDHNAVDTVTITDMAPPADFSMGSAACPHDDEGGAKRGMNQVRLFTFGDLKVAHMGDVGCWPGDEVLELVRGCDLMMIPVGGFFTVDADAAWRIMDAAAPRAVVPMHYRSESFGFGVLSTVEAFAEKFPVCEVTRLEGSSFLLTEETPRGLVIPRPAALK